MRRVIWAMALLGTVSLRVKSQANLAGGTPVLPIRQTVGGLPMWQHRPDAFDRAPKWSLGSTPLAIAGGAAAPDFDLTNARFVEVLSDGRLVTLAPVGNRLLVFRPDGQGEKSLGRTGKGPSELMAPGGMSRGFGDTLVIPDAANNRINWVVATTGFIAEKPLPLVPNGAFVRPVGVLRDGSLVMTTAGLIQNGQDSVTRPPASVVHLTPSAESVSIVARLPDLELLRVATKYRGRAGTQTVPLRFTRSLMAVAWDTLIATGSGDGYRIDLRDTNGKVRSSLVVPVPRRALTRAMRDSTIAAAMRRFDDPQTERMVDPAESRRVAQATPFADSLPPYGRWFISPNKTLWIVDAAAPGDIAGAATAFRQDGAIIGRLTWLGTGSPVAFGNDRVVIRDTDADGIVSLSVFRIQTVRR